MDSYLLQKYKGVATRHTCPGCDGRHSFAYYVSEQDVLLHPSVGKYNHESSRGYHYTSKQYFREYPECHTTNDFSSGGRGVKQKPKQVSQPGTIGYILPHYVEKLGSVHGIFLRFITSFLISYYSSKAKEVLKRLLEEYRLEAVRDGVVVFWQIDSNNEVRTGRAIQYNSEDGRRIKGG